MIRRRLRILRNRRGVSLIEVMIALTILSATLVGLAAATALAAKRAHLSREELGAWAAVQQQLETIVTAGYDSVTSGADTIQGYPMTWSVSGTNPKLVQLVVERKSVSGAIVNDTTVLYLADPDA